MHLPQLRRRFVWPADDLVTMNISMDKAIDVALWWVPGHRPMVPIKELDPSTTISVLGFPRSANSLLTVWFGKVARAGITVLDGRNSHSALDLWRQLDAGIPVVVPVRSPVDACASMLVRQARHESPDDARDMLRAYIAWHTVVGRAMDRRNLVVATFHQVTTNVTLLAEREQIRPLVDPDKVSELDDASLLTSAREELSQVVGQGLSKDGIPAHYLISLPEPARESELAHAKGLLMNPRLESERDRADAIYRRFEEAAADPS